MRKSCLLILASNPPFLSFSPPVTGALGRAGAGSKAAEGCSGRRQTARHQQLEQSLQQGEGGLQGKRRRPESFGLGGQWVG